jgi:uncharacterized protein (TIGR03083 family)
MEQVHSYREAREHFIDLLGTVDADATVPACPGWTVRALLAHQVHQLAGAVDGSFPLEDALAAVSGNRQALSRQQAWIDDGVQRWCQNEARDLCDAWATLAADAPPVVLDGLLPDIAVHVFDLTTVVASKKYRNEPMVTDAVRFWNATAGERLAHLGYDGPRVQLGRGIAIGPPNASVQIVGSPFEVLRLLTGRRARDQARLLVRRAPDAASIDALSPYGWRDSPLIE